MFTPLLPEGVPGIGADPVSFFSGVESVMNGANLPTHATVQTPKSFLLQGASLLTTDRWTPLGAPPPESRHPFRGSVCC